MKFIDEESAITGIADTIINGGVCLFNSIKYIYSIGERDFYNVDIKDTFRIVFNNLEDCENLQALGLRVDNSSCEEMNNQAYNRVLELILYSLAIRVPTLKKFVSRSGDKIDDGQIFKIYNLIINKGGKNHNDIIKESYNEFRYNVRKGRYIAPYNAGWYKSYIYQEVPSLAKITNKNMFLMGFVDIFFTMFYACLEEKLADKIDEYTG